MKGRNILGYLHLLDWTTIDLTTGLDYWTGLLDWTTGLDYWTGLLDHILHVILNTPTNSRQMYLKIVCEGFHKQVYNSGNVHVHVHDRGL